MRTPLDSGQVCERRGREDPKAGGGDARGPLRQFERD